MKDRDEGVRLLCVDALSCNLESGREWEEAYGERRQHFDVCVCVLVAAAVDLSKR